MWHLAKCLAAAAALTAAHWFGRENGKSDQAREDEHEIEVAQAETRRMKAEQAHEAQETAEFSLEALHQAVRDYRNGRGSIEGIAQHLPKPDADKGGQA